MTSNYRNSAGTDLDDVFYVNNSNAGALGFRLSDGKDLGNRYPSGSLGYNVGYKNSAGTDIGFLRCKMLPPSVNLSVSTSLDMDAVTSDDTVDLIISLGRSLYFRFIDSNGFSISRADFTVTINSTDAQKVMTWGNGKVYFGNSCFASKTAFRSGGVDYRVVRNGGSQGTKTLGTVYPNSSDFTTRIGVGMMVNRNKNVYTNYTISANLYNEVGSQTLNYNYTLAY